MERCTIDALPVGARLAEHVRDGSGRLLLQAGTLMHASQREVLRALGVDSVAVHLPARPAAPATRDGSEPAVHRRPDELRPGSVVMRQVLARDGRILLRVGTPVDGRLASTLVRHGVEGVWVRESEPLAAAAAPDRHRVDTVAPPVAPQVADWPEIVRPTERRAAGEADTGQLVPGIGSFRLERVALALGAALDKLAAAGSEEKATIDSEVLFDAGAAVLGEVKTTWRQPFLIEKIAADQPYRLLHPVRSAMLAVRLGAGLGLRDVDLVRLGTAAVLMDVGMALLPASLTETTDQLDPAARALVQRHPELGAQLLLRSGYEEGVGQIVLEHHEDWSGQGYPHQKSGNRTYRSARILNLAMAYVALISDRPYRPAYLPHEAIEYLTAYAGDQFDPALVDTMIRSLPPYPAGARVLLDGDVPATVVDPQIGQPARPIVRLGDGTVVDMAAPGHLNRFVVGVLGVAD
jgi:HD-GYP domain-containing protein (c-di-GMP phosphodiesterase class II)